MVKHKVTWMNIIENDLFLLSHAIINKNHRKMRIHGAPNRWDKAIDDNDNDSCPDCFFLIKVSFIFTLLNLSGNFVLIMVK